MYRFDMVTFKETIMSKSSTCEFKLSKSEINLIKNYCSRASDEDLSVIASSLPQAVIGDRAAACEIFQKDKEMDRWLTLAANVTDFFSKIDSVGDFAILELQARAKKLEG